MSVFPVAILVAAGLWACDSKSPPATQEASPHQAMQFVGRYTSGATGVDVLHDDAHGATCWWAYGSSANGIACLPDSSLTAPAFAGGRP